MKAIIIAAGRGKRLSPLTEKMPKNLLDIGGTTILEMQLDILVSCGIRDVAIIVGHLAEHIETKIKNYKTALDLTLLYNPLFETTDNLVSLWVARDLMADEFITINGDNVFQSSIIEGLLQHEGDIVMATDKKSSYDGDDMKVIHGEDGVHEVSKRIDPQSATAESVGIIKFSKKGGAIYRKVLGEMAGKDKNQGAYYLEAIQEIIARGHRVQVSECGANDWCELDVPSDLPKMRQRIEARLI